jgi:sulfite exporter TauE/SafE
LSEPQILSAFLVGLLGGVHCVGMCGGIVGALTMTLPAEHRQQPLRMLPFLLAYNAGRLASYAAAGALVGGVGYVAANLSGLYQAQTVLSLLAGLFMIALGLYLGGWWFGLTQLEAAGGRLWGHLEPVGRRWLPASTPPRALALGLVWGWLPCGLVYSVLVWALAAGSAGRGAALMLSFGLGTLPTLLALGTAAARLSVFVRQPRVRRAAGVLVIGFGLLQLWRAI